MHLLDCTTETLGTWLTDRDQPGYRAAQIQRWILQSRVASFEEMTNLPATLRRKLMSETTFFSTTIVKHLDADDGTEKLLLELHDGGRIECVLLRDGLRRTICVSSQVGCAMGCVFCASGLDGVDRNLTTGEIVEQMIRLQRLLPADERLSHIVMMGMGEPLANLDCVMSALAVASGEDGLGISSRRITISTIGIPGAMDRLVEMEAKYNLAVSLHAADDALRNDLVAVNSKIGLDAILEAADRYFESSGRRLTFEYVLLAGVNDRPRHARQLARRLRGRPALVNIIPYNPVAGLPYATPSATSVDRFRDVLLAGGLNVHCRKKKGDSINAACGQLRRSSPGVVELRVHDA